MRSGMSSRSVGVISFLGVLVLGAVALGAFAFLRDRPLVETSATDPRAVPPFAPASALAASSVYCVVDERAREVSSRQGTFSTLDASQWWVNVALRGPGGCQRVEASRLRFPLPTDVLVVVVSAAAMPTIAPYASQLETFVRGGGVVVLERPILELAALAGEMGPASSQRLTDLRFIPGDLSLKPLSVDAAVGPLMGSVLPLVDGTPEGSTQRTPWIWLRHLESGGVVGIGADLCHLLMGTIQGHPEEDFTFKIPPREGALSQIPIPADMTASEAPFPVADVLSRAVWWGVSQLTPLPGFWDHPEGRPGVYLSTHDEEGFGDRSAYMAEVEKEQGIRGTYFVLPEPMTQKGTQALQALGAEVVLHWHRGFGGGHAVDRRLGPFLLSRRALGLREQMLAVGAEVGDLRPLTRIHGLQWDADFDSTFLKLVFAGIRLDSSYGPAAGLGPYPFGSVSAFHPLEREGRLLPLWELPFVLQDDEPHPLETLTRAFADAERFSLPVVPIFHVNTMAYKPSEGPLEALRYGMKRARSALFFNGTVGEYEAFLEARASSSFRLTWQEGSRLEGEVIAVGEHQWLRLPRRVGAGELSLVQVDGIALSPLWVDQWQGIEVVKFAIKEGKHTLRIQYRPL